MFSLQWTDTSGTKRHAVVPDRPTATQLARMLVTVSDADSLITDMETNGTTYIHALREGNRVRYAGMWWIVVAVIPGIDLITLRPYAQEGERIMVNASEVSR